MESGIQVDQDNFKAAVELFKNCLKIVEAEIKQSKKTKEAQTTKLFEATCLQKALVFELDDDTPSMDLESSVVRSASVTLNFSARKCKQDADSEPSNDAVLLFETFEKSTNMLAKALVATRSSDSSKISTTTPLQAPSSNTPTLSFNLGNIVELNQQLTKIETGLGGMKSELEDIKTMLGKILEVVLSIQGKSNDGSNKAAEEN